jgi:hypothetical protein
MIYVIVNLYHKLQVDGSFVANLILMRVMSLFFLAASRLRRQQVTSSIHTPCHSHATLAFCASLLSSSLQDLGALPLSGHCRRSSLSRMRYHHAPLESTGPCQICNAVSLAVPSPMETSIIFGFPYIMSITVSSKLDNSLRLVGYNLQMP